jgi:hypothetical protein
MNPEFDKQLESLIDRQLKDLPDLAAPPNLIPQTLNALARPAARRVQPWPEWPAGLRIAYLIATFAALAGAIAGWQAFVPGLLAPLAPRLAQMRAGVEVLWNFLGALAGAVPAVVDHFGKGVILSCVVVVVLAYVSCVGFGTVFVRLAFSPSRKINL